MQIIEILAKLEELASNLASLRKKIDKILQLLSS